MTKQSWWQKQREKVKIIGFTETEEAIILDIMKKHEAQAKKEKDEMLLELKKDVNDFICFAETKYGYELKYKQLKADILNRLKNGDGKE